MRKFLIIALVSISFFSCRVTKSLVMMKVKENAELSDEDYMRKKQDLSSFLNLNSEQKVKCEQIWREEKEDLNMPVLKNENIAEIIYKSEMDFRNVLSKKQLESYKSNPPSGGFFLSGNTLAEIKRIYIDK